MHSLYTCCYSPGHQSLMSVTLWHPWSPPSFTVTSPHSPTPCTFILMLSETTMYQHWPNIWTVLIHIYKTEQIAVIVISRRFVGSDTGNQKVYKIWLSARRLFLMQIIRPPSLIQIIRPPWDVLISIHNVLMITGARWVTVYPGYRPHVKPVSYGSWRQSEPPWRKWNLYFKTTPTSGCFICTETLAPSTDHGVKKCGRGEHMNWRMQAWAQLQARSTVKQSWRIIKNEKT